MSKTNGTVDAVPAAVAARADGVKVVPASRFTKLVRLTERLGEKKAFSARLKTDQGVVTVTVTGKVCNDSSELAAQAAIEGAKASIRVVEGFGDAEGSGTSRIKPEDASGYVLAVCHGTGD